MKSSCLWGNEVDSGRQTPLSSLAGVLLATMAAAFPWEIYQRLPVGFTLVKAAGFALILLASYAWLRTWGKAFPRTRLGLPLLVFFAACVVSLAFSMDRGATLRALFTYATYIALFYAVATWVISHGVSRRLATIFVASSALMGLLAVLAYAGWVKPTFWAPAHWPQQRLIDEWRDGLPMRMAAASEDFNAAALPLIVAFAFTVAFYDYAVLTRLKRALLHAAQFLLAAGVAITMSRSSLLIIVVLALVFLWRPAARRFGTGRLLMGLAVVLALVAVLERDFLVTLVDRAQGGFTRDDGSLRRRFLVYRASLALVPKHLFMGAGLGASDEALKAAMGVSEIRTTLHSVPFKLLLETGLAGLLAYFWIAWRSLRRLWEWGRTGGEPDQTRFALTFIAVALSCFVVTLVQPFTALSIFPFLAGLGLGPAAARGSGAAGARVLPRQTAVAAVVTVAVVAVGIIDYQRAVRKTETFGDALAAAVEAESGFDWKKAAEMYEKAASVGKGIAEERYYTTAATLVDLPFMYQRRMALPVSDADPAVVCRVAEGRMQLLLGREKAAEAVFDRLAAEDPRFEYAFFDLGEALWVSGRYEDALKAYARAGESDFLYGAAAAAKSRLEQLQKEPATVPRALEQGLLLRRLGKWPEAVTVYRDVVTKEPESPEALYNLAVNETLEGNRDEARALLIKATKSDPRHFEAAAALRRGEE